MTHCRCSGPLCHCSFQSIRYSDTYANHIDDSLSTLVRSWYDTGEFFYPCCCLRKWNFFFFSLEIGQTMFVWISSHPSWFMAWTSGKVYRKSTYDLSRRIDFTQLLCLKIKPSLYVTFYHIFFSSMTCANQLHHQLFIFFVEKHFFVLRRRE